MYKGNIKVVVVVVISPDHNAGDGVLNA